MKEKDIWFWFSFYSFLSYVVFVSSAVEECWYSKHGA